MEKAYPKKDFIAKLRRLADRLERGEPFRLQVAGRRIAVPKQAIINIEHERGAGEEEVEFPPYETLRFMRAETRVSERWFALKAFRFAKEKGLTVTFVTPARRVSDCRPESLEKTK